MSSSKLGCVDIGARGGVLARFGAHASQLDIVLVEPEPAEFDRLNALSGDGQHYKVIGTALGHVDGHISFFETVNGTCSSALKVNSEFLEGYRIRPQFAPKQVTVIPCARYDTLFGRGNLPIPHLIKIDVQGFEYQVLQGFGALLNECLALEIETHFYQLYRDQVTIGDMVKFLEVYGFVLRRLSNPRSASLNGDFHFDGDLVELDATFTKKRSWVTSRSQDIQEKFRVACGIFEVATY